MRFPASTNSAPGGEVPRELSKAWLRFHEEKWCRGVDTVFVFGADGMEVWCLVEDEKSYQKFSNMLEPLRKSYRVELYTTFPTREEKKKLKDPPPSLWNNLELRAFLRDPFVLGGVRRDYPVMTEEMIAGRRDFFLKQRVTLFAIETLDWGRSMRRYGSCLPSVTESAFDSSGSPDVQERARAVCADHAQEIEKYTDRIMDNLVRALPKPPKRSEESQTARVESAERSVHRTAAQIRASAQSAAQSIYRFFYPRNHAVRLTDLRDPGMLDSLRALRKMTADFRLFYLQPQRD